jgi:hypothetical protein
MGENMKSFINNEEASSSTVGYLLFYAIFMIFFLVFLFSSNNLLLEGPSKVVVNAQFTDVGNMLGSTLTDMYLIVPENGRINTTYKIPKDIGKEPYIISFANSIVEGNDEVIVVSSTASDKHVNVTLNGMGDIGVEGNVSSSMTVHRIIYNSTK